MHDLIPLNLLSPGQWANVDAITGLPEQVHRLEELGLRSGATVEMVQSGRSCIIRLAGHKLCLRGAARSVGLSVLADLPVGARGRISSIVGSDELSVRLLEMGLTPGVEVTIVGTAPLGDPLELELRGYRLSVRRSEAARVQLAS